MFEGEREGGREGGRGRGRERGRGRRAGREGRKGGEREGGREGEREGGRKGIWGFPYIGHGISGGKLSTIIILKCKRLNSYPIKYSPSYPLV